MIPFAHVFAVVICTIMLSFLSEAHGACFGKIPNHVLDSKSDLPLNESNREMLSVLFEKMAGSWEGEASEIKCKGNEFTAQEVQTEYDISARVEWLDSSRLVINSNWHSFSAKSRIEDTIELHLTGTGIKLRPKSIAGKVRLLSLSENYMVFSSQYRFRGTPIFVVRTLSVSKDSGFQYESRMYTRGMLAGRAQWRLQ